jgi:hypothetical protein
LSNAVRTVQAAVMVGMCLTAGYIIAFGAGAGLAAGLTLSPRLAGRGCIALRASAYPDRPPAG